MPSLSPTQQKSLDGLLALIISPSDKETIRALCTERPDLIPQLLENYQRKVRAIQNEDTAAAKQILADEKKLLASVVA